MAGYPIGYFYGYKVAGVYQNQAEIDASPVNTLATVTPGDLKFADVNGDGKITPDDRTKIGDPTPDVTYGISLGLSYKNWELSMEMMGQGGNQIYRTWDNYNWAQFNYMEQRLDRWHGEGLQFRQNFAVKDTYAGPEGLRQHTEPEDMEAQHRLHTGNRWVGHCFRSGQRDISGTGSLYIWY